MCQTLCWGSNSVQGRVFPTLERAPSPKHCPHPIFLIVTTALGQHSPPARGSWENACKRGQRRKGWWTALSHILAHFMHSQLSQCPDVSWKSFFDQLSISFLMSILVTYIPNLYRNTKLSFAVCILWNSNSIISPGDTELDLMHPKELPGAERA